MNFFYFESIFFFFFFFLGGGGVARVSKCFTMNHLGGGGSSK